MIPDEKYHSGKRMYIGNREQQVVNFRRLCVKDLRLSEAIFNQTKSGTSILAGAYAPPNKWRI